ncbi:MAG: class IV adenylate cyclase [Candidatus Aenigmatarchaeota archaeon]
MEVETKFKTDDLEGLKKKLVKMGAKFSSPVSQVDDYYRFKGGELDPQGPGSVLIRIRRQGSKAFLTTKELTSRAGVWVEHESEIADPAETEEMLKQLGLAKVFSITKARACGKLGEYGLCLDRIKELGDYLEVEVISGDAEGAKKKIMSLMGKLGIAEKDVEHRGYAAIIFQGMGVKYERGSG